MFDPQVSYIRLLVGDNDRNAPFYSDDEIHEAATIGMDRPPFPIDLRIMGTVGKIRFPLPFEGGGSSMSIVVKDITSAEILSLKTTPVELIPAPGANKVIQVTGGLVQLKFQSAPYVTDGDTVIAFEGDDTGDGGLSIAKVQSNNGSSLLIAVEDQVCFVIIPNRDKNDFGKVYSPIQIVNSAVILKTLGTVDPSGGSGTLRIVLQYNTITLA